MKKIILCMMFAVSLIFARKIPITNTLELEISNKDFTILDFPFKIQKLTASKFIVAKDEVKKLKENTLLNDTKVPTVDINNPVIKPRNHTKIMQQNSKSGGKFYLDIKKGVNNLTIFPKKKGNFELIVWGYEKFPIILYIKVVNKRNLDNYLKFSSPIIKKNVVDKFEANPHEKIIQALIKSMYNNHIINGYKMKVNGYRPIITNGLKLKLNRTMIGNRYQVEEWYIRNLTNKTVRLYPQMFYRRSIYGISFENNLLEPKKATRIFVVRGK
jgi:hypothetical protein